MANCSEKRKIISSVVLWRCGHHVTINQSINQSRDTVNTFIHSGIQLPFLSTFNVLAIILHTQDNRWTIQLKEKKETETQSQSPPAIQEDSRSLPFFFTLLGNLPFPFEILSSITVTPSRRGPIISLNCFNIHVYDSSSITSSLSLTSSPQVSSPSFLRQTFRESYPGPYQY